MSVPYRLAATGIVAVLSISGAAVAQSTLTKAPAEVRAGTYVLDPSHSKVTWAVSHFGFSTYVGQFTGTAATLTVDPKAPGASKLDVTVKTDSVGTLNPALDTHLKTPDFLDVAKFPTATFKATSVRPTGARTADIAGNLTLHGVTKPVTIAAEFNQAGVNPIDKKYSLGFAGSAKIKRTDFGIMTYAPMIGDEVTLQIEAEFKAQG